MTIGALMALHECQLRIPDDISLIGFDHFEASDAIEPPLTMIDQPIERIGRRAAELRCGVVLARVARHREQPAIAGGGDIAAPAIGVDATAVARRR